MLSAGGSDEVDLDAGEDDFEDDQDEVLLIGKHFFIKNNDLGRIKRCFYFLPNIFLIYFKN